MLDGPVRGYCAERCSLQLLYLLVEELTTAQDREAQCPLTRSQTMGDAGQGPARATRAADHIERLADLCRDLGASPRGQGVAAALGQQAEPAEPAAQRRDQSRVVLVPVGGPVQVLQPHAIVSGGGQHRIERQVLFPPDDADGGEPVVVARRRGGADVVGVRPAEGEQDLVALISRCLEVVLQLPPLIARDVSVDQVVAFQEQPKPSPGQTVIVQFLQRGRSRSSIGTTGARDHIQPPYSFAFPFAFAGGATVRRSGFGARLHLPPVVLTGCAAVVVARVAGPGVGQEGVKGGGAGGDLRGPPSRPLLHFSAGERANYDEGVRIVPDGWWLGRAGDVRAVCGYAGAAPAMSGAAFRVSGSPIGRCIPAGSGGIQLCACRPVRRRALVWPSARESILRCQFGRAGRVVLPPRRTLLARPLPR